MVNLYHRSNFLLSPSFYLEMFHVSGHLKRLENRKRLQLKKGHGFARTKTAVHFIHVRKIDYTHDCSILDRRKAVGYWRSPDRYCGAKNASNCHSTLPRWKIWARITRTPNFLPFNSHFRPLFFLTFYNITGLERRLFTPQTHIHNEKMVAKEQQRYLFLDDSLKPFEVTLHRHLVEDREKLCSVSKRYIFCSIYFFPLCSIVFSLTLMDKNVFPSLFDYLQIISNY